MAGKAADDIAVAGAKLAVDGDGKMTGRVSASASVSEAELTVAVC